MPSALDKCRQEAKNLSMQERAILIKTLIDELDELDEFNLEQLWIKEAYRRLREFKSGNIRTKLGVDVFHDARTKLQDVR